MFIMFPSLLNIVVYVIRWSCLCKGILRVSLVMVHKLKGGVDCDGVLIVNFLLPVGLSFWSCNRSWKTCCSSTGNWFAIDVLRYKMRNMSCLQNKYTSFIRVNLSRVCIGENVKHLCRTLSTSASIWSDKLMTCKSLLLCVFCSDPFMCSTISAIISLGSVGVTNLGICSLSSGYSSSHPCFLWFLCCLDVFLSLLERYLCRFVWR